MVGESLAPACNGCYIQGSQGVRQKLVEVEEGAKARSEVGREGGERDVSLGRVLHRRK